MAQTRGSRLPQHDPACTEYHRFVCLELERVHTFALYIRAVILPKEESMAEDLQEETRRAGVR